MRFKTYHKLLLIATAMVGVIYSCKKDPVYNNGVTNGNGWIYNPTPKPLVIPTGWPQPLPLPPDNPQTEQGIKLGRMLFYDPILSGDSSQSCASCHQQRYAFTNGPIDKFSRGIHGTLGNRNAPPLFNLIWSSKFFWDGRAASIEDQVVQPVQNPIEMAASWPVVISKLKNSSRYPKLFYEAFGIEKDSIDQKHTAKAMAQFLRTLLSTTSRFDKQIRDHQQVLTTDESDGYEIYKAITVDFDHPFVGDCNHCHGDGYNNPLFMDVNPTLQFRNNGLINAQAKTDFVDAGRGSITGVYLDYGRFKVPSLRNLVFTAPYDHDGRFQTIEEVIDFYSSGVHATSFTDPGMQFATHGGVQLDSTSKRKMVAFLKSLTDSSLVTNPDYANPF